MKSLTSITIGLLFSGIAFTSCQQKEYTCSCSHPLTSGPHYVGVNGSSKKDAKKNCKALEKDAITPPGTPKAYLYDCKLAE